jgi:hypothetical protein
VTDLKTRFLFNLGIAAPPRRCFVPDRNGLAAPAVDQPMSRRLLVLVVALLLGVGGVFASTIEDNIREAQRIRGLSLLHAVRTETIDRSQLPGYLHAQLASSLPYSFDEYAQILAALQLIDSPSAARESKLLDLLQQQVLAFYDPVSHTYFAIRQLPEALPAEARELPLEDAIAVHELTHALQDQHFAIGKADRELRDDWDASLALHAVIEGDATLVMMARLAGATGMSLDELVRNDMLVNALGTAAAMMRSDNSDTPRYFVDELAFPYVQGLRLVIAAYRHGGWDAINRIYSDPPRSTREVMHPDEYFAGHHTPNAFNSKPPIEVPGVVSVEHLGEYHWSFLLGADNARGWLGDRATIVVDAFCQPTVLIETKWESPQRAAAFRNAYVDFLRKRNAAPDASLRGNEVDVGYGADAALVERFITR